MTPGEGVFLFPLGGVSPFPKGDSSEAMPFPEFFFKFLDTNGALCVLSDT